MDVDLDVVVDLDLVVNAVVVAVVSVDDAPPQHHPNVYRHDSDYDSVYVDDHDQVQVQVHDQGEPPKTTNGGGSRGSHRRSRGKDLRSGY